MDQNNHIDDLIAKLAAGTITDTELEELIRWYNSFDDSVAVVSTQHDDDTERLKVRMYQHLVDQIREKPRPKITMIRRFLPYAAAILFMAMGVWYFSATDSLPEKDVIKTVVNDVMSGGNRATLTLANGQVVNLDEAQDGIIVSDDNILYNDGGKLLEQMSPSGHAQYAVLATPKGGTYQITLPDGTRVWLNAASTLRYPNRFEGDERVVELEGEAYFSVTKYAKEQHNIPFKVISKDQTIEVLGTEFNVAAYKEETDIKTTLVNGKVKVLSNNESTILSPGQQSTFGSRGIQVSKVDSAPYTAWKDGMFHFQRTPLEEIMKQIARWYDVEIVYQGSIPQETFSGKVKRDVSLKGVLNILQISTIDIQLKGEALIVSGE